MALDIIVLAAGLGKRMRSDLPKVLHPLAGRPLLAHVLDAARALAPKKIIVVHGHDAERVRAAFPDKSITWALQAEQLGTGHAVMQAMPQVAAEEVVILYGDVPLVRPATLERLRAAAQGGLALLTVELPDAKGYGRVVREGGKVTRIVEERDASPAEKAIREVNAGFMAMDAKRLAAWIKKLSNRNAQKEYYLTDVIALAVGEDVRVEAVKAEDPWEVSGVNSKQELAALERVAQSREAARLLEAGVTLADPARIDVRGALECGRDVSIDVNCVFEGKVRLANSVRIGPHCVLRDVTIAEGSEVRAFSHLDDAEIGARCVVGPYARLRPGARLAEDVHIGNFVEVKASRVGKGSKANHLSYVGDADVGAGSNLGAGTITANYDGFRKSRTVIGRDVRVGVDTMLIAPVEVGDSAYTAAGAVIKDDVPEGALAVSENAQRNIDGYAADKAAKMREDESE
jgi:bifunctional UDP-N-acetylglucosamine pyrophosphorylase/glucosamine-1-phosphate N-acetyltransferase